MNGNVAQPSVSPPLGVSWSNDEAIDGLPTMKLPWGLIGFESLRGATPIRLEGMDPFRWLRFEGQDLGAKGFLVVDSRFIQPVFPMDLDADDCCSIEIENESDLQVWIVVSLSPEGRPMANLRGPIVGNLRTRIFRQVIPNNASDLPLRHPLMPPA